VCDDRFCVCSPCDRGQTSCPEHLFKYRRAGHVDAARERHAKSIHGQAKTRQRKQRQRTREFYETRNEPVPEWAAKRSSPRPPVIRHQTSVTDTGIDSGVSSSKISASIAQAVPSATMGQQPREKRPESLHSPGSDRIPCSFCGHLCGPFFRSGPKGPSPSVRPFRRTRMVLSGEALGPTRPP